MRTRARPLSTMQLTAAQRKRPMLRRLAASRCFDSTDGAGNASFGPFLYYERSFNQDRLGTNIGKVEKRCAFCRKEDYPGFEFENTDQDGDGPESLQNFLDACLGRDYFPGADAEVGLKAVATLDAMYRSALSGKAESTHL
jgi:predicted dehydrogenase